MIWLWFFVIQLVSILLSIPGFLICAALALFKCWEPDTNAR